jgi:cytokinesis protein
MVLHGMELLKRYGPNFGRFDAWMHALEKTLDGRGKMGSAVGASNDLKMTGMVGAGDSQITQYMVKYRTKCIISIPSTIKD